MLQLLLDALGVLFVKHHQLKKKLLGLAGDKFMNEFVVIDVAVRLHSETDQLFRRTRVGLVVALGKDECDGFNARANFLTFLVNFD